MKYLVTDVGEFGPFVDIEEFDDKWVADGATYYKSVVGNGHIDIR